MTEMFNFVKSAQNTRSVSYKIVKSRTIETVVLPGRLRQKVVRDFRLRNSSIEEVWATISRELSQSLYRSIPRRMLAVLDGQGRATKY